MNKRILVTAASFGAIAVIFGAFGAHGLKKVVAADALDIWAKGVAYQFYHTFALLFLSMIRLEKGKFIKLAYWFFTFGTLLFSGSLYLLSTREVLNIGFADYIGPVTPFGGLLLILGWISLLLAASRNN